MSVKRKVTKKYSLQSASETIVMQNLNIQFLEKVLVITDMKMLKFGKAIYDAARKVNLDTNLLVMPPPSATGMAPNAVVAAAMKASDVVIAVTSKSISHTKARREACKAGARMASMPGVSELSFIQGGLTADYNKVRELTNRMYEAIKGRRKVKVESKNGTNVSFEIGDMILDRDTGLIHARGQFGNLPGGEVDTAPNEGSAKGIIVFDELVGYGKNVRLEVSNGSVKKTDNKKLEELLNIMPKARNIAEFGIGTNPQAKIIENTLEDEKVLGTVHMALGNNMTYGGHCDVQFHKDGIIEEPTVEVDGRMIIRTGKWLCKSLMTALNL
jgi:leucyl aminopeptidase (aminopeptidase T)